MPKAPITMPQARLTGSSDASLTIVFITGVSTTDGLDIARFDYSMERIAEGRVVTINATGLIVEEKELPVGPIGDIVSAVGADLIPFAPGIVVTLRHVTCLFAAGAGADAHVTTHGLDQLDMANAVGFYIFTYYRRFPVIDSLSKL